mgnify:FL=1
MAKKEKTVIHIEDEQRKGILNVFNKLIKKNVASLGKNLNDWDYQEALQNTEGNLDILGDVKKYEVDEVEEFEDKVDGDEIIFGSVYQIVIDKKPTDLFIKVMSRTWDTDGTVVDQDEAVEVTRKPRVRKENRWVEK